MNFPLTIIKTSIIERGEVIDDEAAMLAALDRELGLEAPDPAKRAEELRG